MRIIGTGSALPHTVVSADQIDARLGKPAGWTLAASGVARRHVMTEGSQIDLALGAARAALADAGMAAGDMDLIVSACGIGYQTLPSTAPLIQRGLGLADGAVACFDINSTCLSFLTALEVVEGLMATGRYARALVVSAEVASRALPWEAQPEVAALFGDGAAAAVVTRGAGLRAARFRSFPSGYEACEIGAGGTRFDFAQDRAAFEAHARFRMDGRALFRLTAQHFGAFVEAVLAEAGVTREEIDLVVPHQASPGALQHMIRLCGFAPEKVVDIAAEVGNQIAASIPFALDHARRAGRVPAGARVLMLGTSAGVSFGGVVMDF
ncbi:3-oxoacyl-[acyl-carrier-protein] synthase III C-terminal domain-containing protein [Pseudotabrizicola algicola]|uniref:Ketoacyl-ACP synthase III n=1 Tax=Pseudotabrizicola algicola TaxID=2709381 RepID=A0A6B3RUB6_9RHOB|nr:3-oxoacyl-[acyl-carrier-protein] synthase III C-terminal domain-containing protein [Pseudotabrizicola algicola]NEX47535.1 ketoacyl-ACP synthase III [Pseudotabrizicola algicola]